VIFPIFRKPTQPTVTAEDAILVLLDFLGRKGLRRVAESDLHKLIFEVGAYMPSAMKFVQRPTTYSNELFQSLRRLERLHLVDELVYVHDGWVPKHLYEVTRVGHLRAIELQDQIRTFRTLPLEHLFSSVAIAASKRGLLATLEEQEHHSSDPAKHSQ
jgi:hypothetical protein